VEITSSPGIPEPEEIHTMAVYDQKTGEIVHQHHVVRFKGAPKRSKKELEEHAIAVARSQTGFDGSLAVLHTVDDAFDQPGRRSVDVKTKQLRTEAHMLTIALDSSQRTRDTP
jgi:hypothetical protein